VAWLVLSVGSTLVESACSHTRLPVQLVDWLKAMSTQTQPTQHCSPQHLLPGFLCSLALARLGIGRLLGCIWCVTGCLVASGSGTVFLFILCMLALFRGPGSQAGCDRSK
jgi:hypothetical protein